MRYTINFQFRGKEKKLCIDYEKIPNAEKSGFTALKVPFDIKECVGYPMLHAFFEQINSYGYERYCGWIQVIERRDYADRNAEEPTAVSLELDVSEEMREHKIPYFAYGYPAELFDAPCKNLGNSEKLDWRAYTYLVDLPSRTNHNQLVFWAGFSWGYSENINGDIQLLDFAVLSEDNWLEHRKYAFL